MAKRKEQTFAQRMVLTIAASFIMAFTIKSFARPGGIFSGGFNGISLLIIACCEKFLSFSPPFALVNYSLNLIPMYISFRYLGKKLTTLSIVCVVLVGFLTDILPAVPITYDPLLVAVFGGIFNGLWLGRRHRYYRAFYGRNQGAGLLECNLYDECRSAWSCRCPVWLG